MNTELSSLDQAISNAYANEGDIESANRAWLELLRAELYLPVESTPPENPEEPFRPVYAVIENQYFLAAFDTLDRIQTWAKEYAEQLHYVTLSGRDLIAGIGENVFLGLNALTPFYKEFSPEELKHLKKIVARIDALKK